MTPSTHKDIFSYLKHLKEPGLRGFFFFFVCTFGFLIYLGTWQLNRLEWKNNLIQGWTLFKKVKTPIIDGSI